jgi:CheY-like chemotaxis protein
MKNIEKSPDIKILLVDDSSTNNLLFQSILEDEGYEVHVVDTGKKALRFTKQTPPHIILLDIMMPDMDGIEVLKSLKSESYTSSIPVIMVTAKRDKASMERCISMGAADYIEKPISIGDVKKRVKEIIHTTNSSHL